MDAREVLTEAFDRLPELVRSAVDGLTPEELHWVPAPGANSVGWLVWHLTRIQDDHVAGVASTEQVWTGLGWYERFALPLPAADHGYGHRPAQVASVRADSGKLLGYYDAVEKATKAYLAGLSDGDLDRVVDTRWDPPVTLGVRLVSVIDDDVAHAAQAQYVRGIIERR